MSLTDEQLARRNELLKEIADIEAEMTQTQLEEENMTQAQYRAAKKEQHDRLGEAQRKLRRLPRLTGSQTIAPNTPPVPVE